MMKDDKFYPTVGLSLETILRECIKPEYKGKENGVRHKFNSQNNENIHEVFKYRRYTDTFSDFITVKIKGDKTGEKQFYFHPSYKEFLLKLQIILNKRLENSATEEEIEKALKERIEVLKETANLYDLQIKFPHIYKDYKAGVKKLDEISDLKRMSYNLYHQNKQTIDDEEKYVYKCGILRKFTECKKRQVMLYTRCIDQRKELKEIYDKKTYNRFINEYFDQNKLFMYIVYNCLCKCKNLQNRQEIKSYIDVVERYLNSGIDKTNELTVENGDKVTIDIIKAKLEDIKQQIDDKSYNLPWIIAKPGRPIETAQSSPKNKPHRTTLFNQEEINKLRTAGERKEKFYNENIPEISVIGLEKYDGYMGYIYSNGKVVLDKVYNSKAPSTATGNAIFIVNAIDFEALSRKDKTTLSNDPRVVKLRHLGAWETRVKKIIDKEGTKEEQEQAKHLIKRIKEANGC